jgi:hypothetical protein
MGAGGLMPEIWRRSPRNPILEMAGRDSATRTKRKAGNQNFEKYGDKAHALVARNITLAPECRGLNITTKEESPTHREGALRERKHP